MGEELRNEEARNDLESLPVVIGVRTVLSGAASLDQGLNRALTHMGESLGWLFGACWLLDAGAKHLCLRGVWCARAFQSDFDSESGKHRFERGEGLPGRVWETGAPIWVEDVLQDLNFPRREAAAREGLHGAVAFPVFADGVLRGALEFYTDVLRTPTPALMPVLEHLGNCVGQFVAGYGTAELCPPPGGQLEAHDGRVTEI